MTTCGSTSYDHMHFTSSLPGLCLTKGEGISLLQAFVRCSHIAKTAVDGRVGPQGRQNFGSASALSAGAGLGNPLHRPGLWQQVDGSIHGIEHEHQGVVKLFGDRLVIKQLPALPEWRGQGNAGRLHPPAAPSAWKMATGIPRMKLLNAC